jgi:glycosyltransferase involved in cell wall biosynthesis
MVKANQQISSSAALSSGTKKIAIVTCCVDDWGGSEELWARAIPYLISDGCSISIYKTGINVNHPEYIKLSKLGVAFFDLNTPPVPYETISFRVKRKFARMLNSNAYPDPPQGALEKWRMEMTQQPPSLVIISQGINFDGIRYGSVCIDLGIDFVMIAQKAVDFYWPDSGLRAVMKEVYAHSRRNFFIAKHNLTLTEEQIGFRLKNNSLVFNPVKLNRQIIPYPSSTDRYKLACIGRYFLLDKGQDMLIRILAQEKWRNRPISVSFIGSGDDKAALESLAKLLNTDNVEFRGHVNNIEELWQEFHALVLPSRSEGMPLVLLEAMSVGRTGIVSDAGGNGEIIFEGINGFIGAPHFESFDQAMERAWQSRSQWQELGKNAFDYIVRNIPLLPEKEFANQLKMIVHG